jgi:deoxyadenosine/deoxycytidine kinase
LRPNFIAIEGNIGSGKTTLAKLLAKSLNSRLLLEEFDSNPFLEGFYKNPKRFAFSLEMSFMAERYQQLNNHLRQQDLFQPLVIADYMPAKSLLFAQNNLNQDEFKLYREFWQMSLGTLSPPDLTVYLEAPLDKLINNISERGREYETNIKNDYLTGIGEKYEKYLKQLDSSNLLRLETKHLDCLRSIEDLNFVKGLILKKIKA